MLLKGFSPKFLAYEQIDFIPDRIHLVFLDVFVQTGVVGFLFYIGILLVFPLYRLTVSDHPQKRSLAFVAVAFF